MPLDPMLSLVMVGLLSIGCQFVAHRLKVPAILPLLIVGIIIGPLLGILNADRLFGDLLFPIVSLAVAIILFEGALTLKLKDIAGHGKMVRNLCSIGVLITWVIATFAAHWALALTLPLAALFGALVTVTGPTVIMPMLRTVRPTTKLAQILRWEGIVIDPIGALLAVLVFEFIIATQDNAFSQTLLAFAKNVGFGGLIGSAGGYALGVALRQQWIPHYLRNTAVLTMMLGLFAASNALAHESGLLAVTLAGMMLANMRNVDVEDIVEFKETLSVLLISGLFILLATRLDIDAVMALGWGVVLVIVAIIFVARPLSVLASSVGTGLSIRELALLSWIAPRGIVAAAVSALFSLKLEALGYNEAALIVPMVFLVIISTVVLQSLTARAVAQALNVRAKYPQGYLFFGANPFSRALAKEMQRQGIHTIVADTNWDAIREARMMELPVYFGNPASDHAARHLDLSAIGRVLVTSPYKQLNPMIAYHFEYVLGSERVWALSNNEQQVRPSHRSESGYASKAILFGEGVTYAYLASRMGKGAQIKTTRLTETFGLEEYRQTYGTAALPLVALDEKARPHTFLANKHLTPVAGWKLISLIEPEARPQSGE